MEHLSDIQRHVLRLLDRYGRVHFTHLLNIIEIDWYGESYGQMTSQLEQAVLDLESRGWIDSNKRGYARRKRSSYNNGYHNTTGRMKA